MKKRWMYLTLAASLCTTATSRPGQPAYTNHLITEKSPYLLQHAHNPVNWYPWGDEAFDRAKREDKPIFLSIGYATCHWCHVMEHESFENEEIAALMNAHFVCIKVDREERPDIDAIYMSVCQMMTGSGGWPMTLFMTPDKKPFYAATYIPAEQRFGRMGLRQLLPRISEAWTHQREKILESAGQITDVLAHQHSNAPGETLQADLLEKGYQELMSQYDPRKGGFGGAPKFPTPHRLVFMLRQGKEEGIRAVEHTLEEMRKGGIFDQVGFGFHRYSTDDHWLVPHFEKMLYDQALLAMAYTEAFELTGKRVYKQVADEILTYVLRDMTSPLGGFYSAEDADSDGEEGLFYLWDLNELKSVLGPDAAFVANVWNLSKNGNYRDESTGKTAGKNIPHLSAFLNAADRARLEKSRVKLFDVREKRIHPLKDTKVLADWNGLMIAALAKAGRAFGDAHYSAAAEKAVAFVTAEMTMESGELWHRWREKDTAVQGHLEDYAFMISGLLELYETTFNLEYLKTALDYNKILDASFKDAAGGGYFMTSDHSEALIVRPKDFYDGARPSGNSVQLLNVLKLARLTGRSEFEQQAADISNGFGSAMNRAPSNFAQALIGLQFAEGETSEIVVVGDRENKTTQEMMAFINRIYAPGKVVLFKDPADGKELDSVAPFTVDLRMVDGKTTVYICRNFACERPINSLETLKSTWKD